MLHQSGLFAAVESQLLVFIKDPSNLPKSMSDANQTALLAFCYLALLFNCSSTVSSFVLSNEFRKIGIRAAKTDGLDRIEERILASDIRLLQLFGASPLSKLVMWYCACDSPSQLPGSGI